MIRVLTGLPMWLQATGSAIAAGLLLGLLVGALLSGGSSAGGGVTVQDPWQQRQLDVETLLSSMLSSANWNRGAVPVEPEPEEPEPEPEDPTRPGAFRYLHLIAILRNPGLEAVFRPEKMPDDIQQLMISSPDDVGLLRVAPDEEIVSGWLVSDISDTRLVIREIDGDRLVEYRLFDWHNVDN